MPHSLHDGTLVLEGVVAVEEAEPVTARLRAGAVTHVDLGTCRSLHTAVLQALLVGRVPVSVPPSDAFLREHVLPSLLQEESP